MQISSILAAAGVALGVHAQQFAGFNDLDTCLRNPGVGVRYTCPGTNTCYAFSGGIGYNVLSYRGGGRVLAYTNGNCAGPYTFIGSNVNSCMPTSAGSKFMSFRCGVLSARADEDEEVEEGDVVEVE
ncbi:hypothetical protein HJFPF1_10766 [Paramyrothecium foliicola]|nr:hypothetical protein HJFPF1_10766 [Paramyrothecium foliicola]